MNANPVTRRLKMTRPDVDWDERERESSQWAQQRIAELKQQRHWTYRYMAGGLTRSGRGLIHAPDRATAIQKMRSDRVGPIDPNSLQEISYEQMREMLCSSDEWDLDDCSAPSRRHMTYTSPTQFHENPLSKGTKMALMIGGGATVLGVAAYFLFFRSTASAAGATGGQSGQQTGGTYQGGTQKQCTPPAHLINGKCITLLPIHMVSPCPAGTHFDAKNWQCVPIGGQPNQPPAGQPPPSPVVVQDGNALSYQAPPVGSALNIQLPQWCQPTNVSWSGSGTPTNLGPTTTAGTETVQLIWKDMQTGQAPGSPGTLTVNWQDLNNNNAPGSATIALT